MTDESRDLRWFNCWRSGRIPRCAVHAVNRATHEASSYRCRTPWHTLDWKAEERGSEKSQCFQQYRIASPGGCGQG
jgi:hypothetical protein